MSAAAALVRSGTVPPLRYRLGWFASGGPHSYESAMNGGDVCRSWTSKVPQMIELEFTVTGDSRSRRIEPVASGVNG